MIAINHRRGWTEDDDDTLKRLVDEQVDLKAMSKRLGRSVTAIEGRVAKLGLTRSGRRRPDLQMGGK